VNEVCIITKVFYNVIGARNYFKSYLTLNVHVMSSDFQSVSQNTTIKTSIL